MNRTTTSPIVALHADDTACTHRQRSSGAPEDGEQCPGRARYSTTCTLCGWDVAGGIRAYVEEQKKTHTCREQVSAWHTVRPDRIPFDPEYWVYHLEHPAECFGDRNCLMRQMASGAHRQHDQLPTITGTFTLRVRRTFTDGRITDTVEHRGPAASVTSTLLHVMAGIGNQGPLLVANDGDLWLLCAAAGCPDRVLAIFDDAAATVADIAEETALHFRVTAHTVPIDQPTGLPATA
ncbi:MAG: hypothetical protein HOV87_31240 [Catenulispora sp.]|nr:hypothetical protein [Catenulispora sp.]